MTSAWSPWVGRCGQLSAHTPKTSYTPTTEGVFSVFTLSDSDIPTLTGRQAHDHQ